MGTSAQRAASLNGASLVEVLTTSGFSLVLQALTAAQRKQLQNYLDAAVVNPVVRKEAEALLRKGTRRYGDIVYTDPEAKRRADRAMRDRIAVGKLDDRVRLDIAKLLDAKALVPTTDNPDEADYLERVRKTLEQRGVWLRLAQKLVRDAADPSQWVSDPRQFEVWLSLGPDGDEIPTKSGRIDREALLGTTVLGAGYYDSVHRGSVQKALEHEITRLSSEIDAGMTHHFELARIRRNAALGVVFVSDKLGGATFPDVAIWQGPHRILLRAMGMLNDGKIYGCRALLVTAALATRNAAHLLARYIDDTTSGGASAVKMLKVARTAGKVAEVGLMATGVVALVRGGAAVAGSTSVSEATVDALAEREVAKYLARNPELAGELSQVRLVAGPKGTVLGNVKGGHSAGYGKGFDRW